MSNSKEDKDSKIKLLIDELRVTFTSIQTTDNSLEEKASALFGFSAILITIIIYTLDSILSSKALLPNMPHFLNQQFQLIFLIFIIINIGVIIGGLMYLIRVIRPRDYTYPFTDDPNEISKKLDMSYEELEYELIEDYRDTIPHHKCITFKKEFFLTKALNWLYFGIIMSFLIMVSLIYLKIAGGFYG